MNQHGRNITGQAKKQFLLSLCFPGPSSGATPALPGSLPVSWEGTKPRWDRSRLSQARGQPSEALGPQLPLPVADGCFGKVQIPSCADWLKPTTSRFVGTHKCRGS